MAFSFDQRAKTVNHAELQRREARKAAIDLLNSDMSIEETLAQVPGLTMQMINEIYEDGCILSKPSITDLSKPYRATDQDLH